MASVSALQYPQPAGRMEVSSMAGLESVQRSRTFPLSTYQAPFGSPHQESLGGTSPQTLKAGAVVAAQAVAQNHAKLHKKNSISRPRVDTGVARQSSPPSDSTDVASSYGSPKCSTPGRSMSRDKLKQNIRKLSQQKEESAQPQIDLSRTAEENEELSGLGISSPGMGSYTFSDASPIRGHGRTVSHASQQSVGSFKPSAPFTIGPLRESPQPESPIHNAIIAEGHDEEDGSECAGSVEFSRSTSFTRPPLRHNNSAHSNSPSRLADQSQTNLSIASGTHTTYSTSSFTRPRRSTNQSVDTMTPKSRTSIDRAFSIVSRSKSRESASSPMDPLTRAASIHAARQAFAAREQAEQRKHEESQRKASRRQERRERRKSDAKSIASMPAELRRPALGAARKSFHGFEYADMPRAESPGTAPKQRAASLPAQGGGKRRSVKTRYVRTVTWIKIRLFRLGESAKK